MVLICWTVGREFDALVDGVARGVGSIVVCSDVRRFQSVYRHSNVILPNTLSCCLRDSRNYMMGVGVWWLEGATYTDVGQGGVVADGQVAEDECTVPCVSRSRRWTDVCSDAPDSFYQ